MEGKSTNSTWFDITFSVCPESLQGITCLLTALAYLGWLSLSSIFKTCHASAASCLLITPQSIQNVSLKLLVFDVNAANCESHF